VYNDKLLFKEYFGDTIYHVSTASDEPYLVFDQGSYKTPVELMADFEKRNAQGYNYIDFGGYRISSHYCFVDYWYDRLHYYDVWDTATNGLLYRFISSADNDYAVGGIDVMINDIKVRAWPTYAEGNTIYCHIQPDDVLKLYPSAPEDTNPMILEATLK
jgi:hypothetical protein